MSWSLEASLEVPHGNLDAPAPQSVRTDGSSVSLYYTKEDPHLPEEVNILQISTEEKKTLTGPGGSHMVSSKMGKQWYFYVT